MQNQTLTLSEKDQLYNWHPYTQHQTAQPHPVIVKGKDELLWDANGKEYIDAISSWWVNPFGHCNAQIANAISTQLQKLEHVLFGGFTHEPAILLSEKLAQLLPNNQKKFFYSDNGSTAVEVAIKTALQFFYNKNQKKTKIIAFENAFHGDTFGAMAASGISFFTQAFQDSLIEVTAIPVPIAGKEQETIDILHELVQTNQYAAFIFEPLVQGAAGMVMYEANVLDQLIAICKANQVFTIADEVMTGFGKTGKTFACNYLQQQPDMMCLSKALTGGTIPMAVTSFTNSIFEGFLSTDTNKALFHGHTFTANPTGCAAALASIAVLEEKKMQENIAFINQQHLVFQEHIQHHKKVKTTRVLGVIFALELKTEQTQTYYSDLRNKLYAFFIENGVILRPIGSIIYIMPPYICSKQNLEKIYQTIEKAIDSVD